MYEVGEGCVGVLCPLAPSEGVLGLYKSHNKNIVWGFAWHLKPFSLAMNPSVTDISRYGLYLTQQHIVERMRAPFQS